MKNKLPIILKLIGPVILIIILISVDLKVIYQSLQEINLIFIIYCSFLLILLYFLKALRWRILLRIQGIQYSITQSLLVILSANFIAFITPGRFGEIVKAFYLKIDKNIPLSKSTPSVIVDRLYDVYLLLLFGFSGIIYFSMWNQFRTFSYLLIIFIVLLHLLFLNRKMIIPIARKIFSIGFLKDYKEEWIESLNQFFNEINVFIGFRLIPGFLITIVAYLVLFSIGHLINIYFHFNLNYLTVVFFISIANILSFLPISVSGIGTREAGLVFLFSQIDKTKEEALVFSTLLFVIFYVLGGLFGFIGYSIKPIKIEKIIKKGRK